MNIPQSAIEPFGETGIPTIQLHKDYIRQKIVAIFNATDDFNIELIDDVRDQLERFGLIAGHISLHLTPDGDGCLLIVRFRYPHKSKHQRLVSTRRLPPI